MASRRQRKRRAERRRHHQAVTRPASRSGPGPAPATAHPAGPPAPRPLILWEADDDPGDAPDRPGAGIRWPGSPPPDGGRAGRSPSATGVIDLTAPGAGVIDLTAPGAGVIDLTGQQDLPPAPVRPRSSGATATATVVRDGPAGAPAPAAPPWPPPTGEGVRPGVEDPQLVDLDGVAGGVTGEGVRLLVEDPPPFARPVPAAAEPDRVTSAAQLAAVLVFLVAGLAIVAGVLL